jgi:hypothetical protein
MVMTAGAAMPASVGYLVMEGNEFDIDVLPAG